MITFLWVGAALIFLVGAYIVAISASKRKRTGQAGQAVVNDQLENSGKPTVGRASGIN